MPTQQQKRLLLSNQIATLALDTFNDVDSTSLPSHKMNIGTGWTAQTGTMQITSNRCAVATVTSALSLQTVTVDRANVTIEAIVRLSVASGTKGLVARFVDLNNHFIIVLNSSNSLFEIYDRVASVYTSRVSKAFTSVINTDYIIKAVCKDNVITATVNDQVQISYTGATAGQTSQIFGLRSSDLNCIFDDFKITS